MSDVLSQDDRDVCARAAFAEIEAVLDRRCPEMKVAFWAAVDRHYRLDISPDGLFEALSGPGLDGRLPAQDHQGSSYGHVLGTATASAGSR